MLVNCVQNYVKGRNKPRKAYSIYLKFSRINFKVLNIWYLPIFVRQKVIQNSKHAFLQGFIYPKHGLLKGSTLLQTLHGMVWYILIFGQRKTMTYLCGQENTPIAVIAITARQGNVWLYTISHTHGRLLYKRYAYVKQVRCTHRLQTHIHITHIYFLWKTKK